MRHDADPLPLSGKITHADHDANAPALTRLPATVRHAFYDGHTGDPTLDESSFRAQRWFLRTGHRPGPTSLIEIHLLFSYS